jgi:hypothetical protein
MISISKKFQGHDIEVIIWPLYKSEDKKRLKPMQTVGL